MTDADYDALRERERKLWLDMLNLSALHQQKEKEWEAAQDAVNLADRLRDKLQAERRREVSP